MFQEMKQLIFLDWMYIKKTVLVVGGSLGAKSINEAIAKGLEQFLKNNIQLIWQTGKTTAEHFIALAKDKKGYLGKCFYRKNGNGLCCC